MSEPEPHPAERRFWVKADVSHVYWDGDGFLLDPETAGEEERGLVRHLTTLTALRDVPCLILLGSPGLGKTFELRHEVEARDDDARSLFVDLGSTRSEARIERKLFDSAEYRDWLEGSHILHLCLDSLDEAQANMGTITDLLMEGLSDAPVERLRLRIACREAERSRRLEDFLSARFPADGFSTFRLLPLRARDARAIAAGHELDVEAFLGEVITQRLQPLAMSPITLNLLLGIVTSTGELPETRAEAYRQGCLILCGETSERREARHLAPQLTPGQRFAVAARVAAVMALSGRTVVGRTSGLPELDEVSPEELAGGLEIDRSTGIETPLEIGLREVEDTLRCALFKGSGNGLTFSHRSYGEFLAAEWISGGALETSQVEGLMLERGEPQNPVWPQLQGLASWLAAISQEQFEWLLSHDPTAILDTDLTMAPPEHRKRIVNAWIRDRVDVPRDHDPVDRAMGRLHWPEAAQGLRDTLFDRDTPIASRIVSAQLIAAAGFSELDDDLAETALDGTQPHALRVAALRALRTVGRAAVKKRLVPLAVTNAEDDPDDLIQAVALFLTWPDQISTAQALDAFHLASSDYSRSFDQFYAHRLAQMPASDYGLALRWCLQVGSKAGWPISVLRDNLLCVASDSLADPAVAEPYIEMAIPRIQSHRTLTDRAGDCDYSLPFSKQDSRRVLLEALIARVAVRDLDISAITRNYDLVKREDREWVAAKSKVASSPAAGTAWDELAAAIPPDREPAFSSTRPNRDGPPTQAAKEADAKLGAALGRFDEGDLGAFRAVLDLLRVDNQGQLPERREVDVWELPGWDRQNTRTHDRILAAAEQYIRRQPESSAEEWFDNGKAPRSDWDAYRAIRLLKQLRPGVAEAAIDVASWSRWTPALIAAADEDELAGWARAETARAAPTEYSSWFERRLARDIDADRRVGALSPRYHLGNWTPQAEAVVLGRARDSSLPVDLRESLFSLLLWNDSIEGTRLAEDLVSASRLDSAEGRDLAKRIAVDLAGHAEDGGWPNTWRLMLADRDFAGEFIEALGIGGRYHSLTSKLDPRARTDLLLMLNDHYPRAAGDGASGGFAATQIRGWANALIGAASDEATPEAIEQLDRLVDAFPEHEYLRYVRYLARLVNRRSEWLPPTPRDVVHLAEVGESRWIASPAALSAAVLTSLRRAEAELHDQPPAAEQLWSNRPTRPKDESAISNWIALFLRRDLADRGVVVGREVQIGAAPRGGRGESVDLQVDAIEPTGKHPTTHSVIIEVKCCWNRELDQGMESQLVDRYLATTHTHGIYLIPWFGTADWADESDERRNRCQGASAADLQSSLSEKAEEVSRRRGVKVMALVLDCSLRPSQSKPAAA